MSYAPTYDRYYEEPYWGPPTRDHDLDAAVAQLQREAFDGSSHPAHGDRVREVLTTARRHGSTDYFVWGPRLVRSVLSPDAAAHRHRSLEQRMDFAERLRVIIHYGHHTRDIDPDWQRLTVEAFEQARRGLFDGAPTDAQLRRRARLDELAGLAIGHDIADLGDDPLTLDDLGLEEVADDLHERVRRLDALIDAALEQPEEPVEEIRAVARRLLLLLATDGDQLLRRPSRDDNLAAGIAIVAAEGNGLLDNGWGGDAALSAKQIAFRIGTHSGARQRGHDACRAAGVRVVRPPEPHPALAAEWSRYAQVFADPRLQTSQTRRLIVASWHAWSNADEPDCTEVIAQGATHADWTS